MKIANKDARAFVQKEHPFEGSNLYAEFGCNHETKETWYVVYSYGLHYPMFVRANGVWFENEDKYSPTTQPQTPTSRTVGDAPLDQGRWVQPHCVR